MTHPWRLAARLAGATAAAGALLALVAGGVLPPGGLTVARAANVAAMAGVDTTAGVAGSAPRFGDAFWKFWGDGQAELAGYDLVITRYGASRKGTAVAIFVTETFSNALRVKADPGRHPAADEFPVMKLNLVQDFSTGIYDYNVMTSAFSALAPVNGLPDGGLTKVSFSAQEWCGQVYAQARLGPDSVQVVSHSYFDGEADRTLSLPLPAGALGEDALLLWARGLAGPALEPGQALAVPILSSLRLARLTHTPLAVTNARLSRAAAGSSIHVPAGTFRAERFTAALDNGRTWAIDAEAAAPHRILRWTRTDTGADGQPQPGETAELLAATRLKYWQMNGPGFEKQLAKLGLTARPPRTP